jgi:predicted transcriptional regulator
MISQEIFPKIYRNRGGLYVEIDQEILRSTRKQKGLTQRELAEMVGINKKVIYVDTEGGFSVARLKQLTKNYILLTEDEKNALIRRYHPNFKLNEDRVSKMIEKPSIPPLKK